MSGRLRRALGWVVLTACLFGAFPPSARAQVLRVWQSGLRRMPGAARARLLLAFRRGLRAGLCRQKSPNAFF